MSSPDSHTRTLGNLLTNHLFMGSLFLVAFGLPLLVSGGIKNGMEPMLGLSTVLGLSVQSFWLVGTFLLLGLRRSKVDNAIAAGVILSAMGLAAVMAVVTGVLPVDPAVFTGPTADRFFLLLPIGVSLYFVTMALAAGRLSNSAAESFGNFLLMFYWPITLSIFSRRLKAAFDQAERMRAMSTNSAY